MCIYHYLDALSWKAFIQWTDLFKDPYISSNTAGTDNTLSQFTVVQECSVTLIVNLRKAFNPEGGNRGLLLIVNIRKAFDADCENSGFLQMTFWANMLTKPHSCKCGALWMQVPVWPPYWIVNCILALQYLDIN